jgi:penicillin-binding protein 1A
LKNPPEPSPNGTPDEPRHDAAGAAPDPAKPKKLKLFGLIEIDAWIDNAVWRAGTGTLSAYERLSIFMRRFRLSGWKKLVVELLDDAATFGTLGTILMLALALPAFQETRKDWRRDVDYAVTFLDRNGNEIGRRGILLNDSVPLAEFPDHLIKAVMATEDRRFFDHFGIDVIGTMRAVVANMRRKTVVQGGSSLTQQLAKNLFLTNERSIERKIKEAFLALWLEANLSKREILKLYLDRAYMGGGTFGVAAASEFYFGKSVRDINLAEAAMLAGLFKAPTKYAPHANLPAARARANDVLSNLVAAGFMTEGQVLGARRHPAKPIDRKRDYTPDYYLDYAFGEIENLAPKDHTLVVKTTLDTGIQKKAEESVEAALRQYGEEYDISQAASVIMEPDGAVRAMVGGREYGASQFNRATDALRQPGSSFKPYVYLTALLAGRTPNSLITDQPFCIGNWCPKNYGGGYYGRVTLSEAIARSLNSVPVQLAQQIGREKVAALARSFGLPIPEKPEWPFVIGATEVHVIDQAAGFAVFANGGYKVEPYAIDQITTTSGKLIYDHRRDAPAPKRIVPAEKIAELNSMLNHAVEAGTGQRAKLDGIPAGGKTGTTQSSRDAWFCGFTGNYVGVVWVGNDDYHPMNRVTGGMVPAPIWHEVMAYAHQNVDLKQAIGFPAPRGKDGGALVAGNTPKGKAAAEAAKAAAAAVAPPEAERPHQLSSKAVGVLSDIETTMRNAPPLKAQQTSAVTPAGATGSIRPVTPATSALRVVAGERPAGRGLVEMR